MNAKNPFDRDSNVITEILSSQGEPLVIVSKKIGVSSHTYYLWRREYGSMRVDQARRLRELEQENSRLKKLVADLSPDNAILRETSRGSFQARLEDARW
jgi:putative transposase